MGHTEKCGGIDAGGLTCRRFPWYTQFNLFTGTDLFMSVDNVNFSIANRRRERTGK
jgi:hypothetical protein